MVIPAEFDSIRPFEPQEIPAVVDRLKANEQFKAVMEYLYPDVPFDALMQQMRQCSSSLDFQVKFVYEFMKRLRNDLTKGITFDSSAISNQRNYTFISNHRDIVLDSALLDVLLIEAKFKTTCEMAIGDNLLSLPWVKDMVRLNKAFIVERQLPPRQLLMASVRLANYMHFAIKEKNENIWIAQREGRAKDSDDRTQEAVLKMIAMGGEGTAAERLQQMHIVPLTISYEYDPCDFLKAKEFQHKRDKADFKKSALDDVVSMQTGIMGYKGHVHYHCAECIDDFIEEIKDAPKTDFFTLVAQKMDKDIHSHYKLFPCNYIALDKLTSANTYSNMYSAADVEEFEKYMAKQLAKIELTNKDTDFLTERMLTMYANPVRNFMAATKQ